jgi:hypothetical protein
VNRWMAERRTGRPRRSNPWRCPATAFRRGTSSRVAPARTLWPCICYRATRRGEQVAARHQRRLGALEEALQRAGPLKWPTALRSRLPG